MVDTPGYTDAGIDSIWICTAFGTAALTKQAENLLKEQQGKVDAQAEETRRRNREASALDLDQTISALERVENIRADSALRQIERAGQVGHKNRRTRSLTLTLDF